MKFLYYDFLFLVNQVPILPLGRIFFAQFLLVFFHLLWITKRGSKLAKHKHKILHGDEPSGIRIKISPKLNQFQNRVGIDDT
jgi:hypothetical protein